MAIGRLGVSVDADAVAAVGRLVDERQVQPGLGRSVGVGPGTSPREPCHRGRIV